MRKVCARVWSGAAALVALLACAPTTSQAQTAADPTVWLQAYVNGKPVPDGPLGQGVFIRSAKGCVLVTAAHVVAKASKVTWKQGRSTGVGQVAQTIRRDGRDIAFIQPEVQPADCPEPASATDLATVAGARDAELFFVDEGGAKTRVPLTQTGVAPTQAFSPSVPGQSIQVGYSGAGVYSSGVLFGIITSVDNSGPVPKAGIQRFDQLPPDAQEWLMPATTPSWLPFDVRQLPRDVQVVAQTTRRDRTRAETAEASALAVARRAAEAAEEARRWGPKGERFAVIQTPEGEYAGAVARDAAGRAIPKGLGVLTTLKGDQAGRQVECEFVELMRCKAEGRYKNAFKDQAASWTGQLCGIHWCQLGVLVYKNGDRWIGGPERGLGVTYLYGLNGDVHGFKSETIMPVDGLVSPRIIWVNQTGKLFQIKTMNGREETGDRTGEAIAQPPP